MRRVYVYRDGVMVDKADLPPRGAQGGINEAPHVIRDGLDDLRHPATGEIVDSKSRFRRITRDAGCIEIGNEEQRAAKPEPVDPSRHVGQAMQMVREGYRPEIRRSALSGFRGARYVDFDD